MESVLREIVEGKEEDVRTTLKNFNEKNVSNFKLDEPAATIEDFCTLMLSHLSSEDWFPATCVLALNALRIVSRQHNGCSKLTSRECVASIVKLAGLNMKEEEMEECMRNKDGEHINVLVEAVKCLCNLVLNNHYLARTVAELGSLHGLKGRLALGSSPSCSRLLPHDVLFFDLRLLFLITACGPEERIRFRDDHESLPVLICLLDSTFFPPTLPPEVSSSQDTADTSTMQESSKDASQESHTSQSDKVEPKDLGTIQEHGTLGSQGGTSGSQGGTLGSQDQTLGSQDQTLGSPDQTLGSQDASIQDDEEVKSKVVRNQGLFPVRDECFVLPEAMTEKKCLVVSEILKIIFNQTVHWKEDAEYDDEELEMFVRLSHLLRLLICSIPLLSSKATFGVFNHSCEVVMNLPYKCCCHFLISSGHPVTPALRKLYPTYYQEHSEVLYCCELDREYEKWSMPVVVALLNALNHRVSPELDKIEKHSLTVILGACSLLSKGCRIIRKFLRAEILPPLKEVRERPELGDSLKSRIVRLMTASTHDCMDVVAEFLFVLCKENASRLVKHTGYGNAAGLLMSHGLLQGERSIGQEDYSSDSGSSDTEEYYKSEQTLDPVTGGPSASQGPSPLDCMSEEELEREAEKLGGLLDKLNSQGIIKLIPVDKDNQPVQLPHQAKPNLDHADSSSDESESK